MEPRVPSSKVEVITSKVLRSSSQGNVFLTDLISISHEYLKKLIVFVGDQHLKGHQLGGSTY